MVKSLFKLCAIYILKLFMILLHVFPVKNNRIIFNSYSGRQYACNPKYISMYLNEKYTGKYELIWAIRNASSYKWLTEEGIKVVEYYSLKRLFYEATAKVSINNVGSFSWMPNTKNQLRINTWHGGGCYKKVGLSETCNDMIKKRTMELTAKNTSYMLSTSKYFTEKVLPIDMGYFGKVLDIGFPRNDILFNGDVPKISVKVREYFNLDIKTKVILYAPTWRYEVRNNMVIPDFERVKDSCTRRFGGDWVVLLRTHDLMKTRIRNLDCIDATEYPDIQELLVAVDILISDYSSCIWDFSLQKNKLCFLFTPDLKSYREERGFDIDIYEWGFPVCISNEELINAISTVNLEDFIKKMEGHHECLGNYDRGEACKKIARLICDFCFET